VRWCGYQRRAEMPKCEALQVLAPLPCSDMLPQPTIHCVCRDVILEKHYRGVTSRASVEVFWEEVAKRGKRDVSRLAAMGGRLKL